MRIASYNYLRRLLGVEGWNLEVLAARVVLAVAPKECILVRRVKEFEDGITSSIDHIQAATQRCRRKGDATEF